MINRISLLNQMMLLVLCVCMSACASKTVRVGSDGWHQTRIAEIQAAYDKGELTHDKYLELKNQADQIRAEYESASRYNHHSGVGYRYGSGGSIGVGVGF